MYENLFLRLLVDTGKNGVSHSFFFFLSIVSYLEFFPPTPIALSFLHMFSYIFPLSLFHKASAKLKSL